jgi:hypothetical protein
MRTLRRPTRALALCAIAALTLAASVFTASPASARPPNGGYFLLTSDGGVFDFAMPFRGAPASDPAQCAVAPLPGRAPRPNGTCGSMATTPNGNGYWVLNSITGAIYRFGFAPDFGSPKVKFAGTSPEFLPLMQQIVAAPDGKGYWVYEIGASDTGTVDHYGSAGFFGDTTSLITRHRVAGFRGSPVAMAATPDGKGYWEVYSDGGVFAFGDAPFKGSMARRHLASPIVGIVASATGKGYWLVGSDGGVFAFGDAPFAGSTAGLTTVPIIGMARNPVGPGYWLAGEDGSVFTFGGVNFFGTLSGKGVHGHVVAIAARYSSPPG